MRVGLGQGVVVAWTAGACSQRLVLEMRGQRVKRALWGSLWWLIVCTALPACHTQVVAVYSSIRSVAVLDSCVIGRMKATEFMV